MNSLPIKAIKKNVTYSEKIYQQLKRLIMTNQIEPGAVLNERTLADQLQVSRTPIRDALRMLEQNGWVVQDGKNKIVREFTWDDLQELIEIRPSLERLIYDLAYERVEARHFQRMEEIIHEMEVVLEAPEFDCYTFMETDTTFHLYMAEITGNSRLYEIFEKLCEQLVRTSVMSVQYGQRSNDEYIVGHQQLLDCYRNREFDKGIQVLDTHMEVWKQNLSKVPDTVGEKGACAKE